MLIRNKQIINGKIDHIDIKDNKVINCSNCKDLITLPNWQNVTYVNCRNCPNLTFLPNWQNVTYVNCCNCPNLTFLPNWQNVIEVICSSCEELSELPNWSNVTHVICYNCPNLKELPNWPNVKIVECNSIKLKELPNWSNIEWVYCSDCPDIIFPEWKTIKYISCYNSMIHKPLPKFYNLIAIEEYGGNRNLLDLDKYDYIPMLWLYNEKRTDIYHLEFYYRMVKTIKLLLDPYLCDDLINIVTVILEKSIKEYKWE